MDGPLFRSGERMSHFHQPETIRHGGATFYRCADVDCQIPMYELSHPSLCKRCGHGLSQHTSPSSAWPVIPSGGCNASVREGLDGVARCECLESYGV